MQDELVQLATVYQQPGFLLLATGLEGQRLGCVGLRSLGSVDGVLTAEIRRLFVHRSDRGTGLGRLLVQRLLDEAGVAGFGRIVLNTLPVMHEAVALYESIGCTPVAPYVNEPLEHTLYMGVQLKGSTDAQSYAGKL